MAKELTHRADELKDLGWNQEDLFRYIELWDYRQRWGAINLEREDRQFLRKAESLLPVIVKNKVSVKKPLKEKSYYRWLEFFLDEMNTFESKNKSGDEMIGIWPIILEEEISALEYFEPVLGLPDTIKAKLIGPLREELVKIAMKKYEEQMSMLEFDFEEVINNAKSNKSNSSWRSIRDVDDEKNKEYQIINKTCGVEFRKIVREKLFPFIKDNLPSLSETDKSLPPND